MLAGQSMERRLQIAGILIILGLLTEAICLMWTRPAAFVVFLGLGGFLIAAGILLYLYSLASAKIESAK